VRNHKAGFVDSLGPVGHRNQKLAQPAGGSSAKSPRELSRAKKELLGVRIASDEGGVCLNHAKGRTGAHNGRQPGRILSELVRRC
jgi:hypothetical protein